MKELVAIHRRLAVQVQDGPLVREVLVPASDDDDDDDDDDNTFRNHAWLRFTYIVSARITTHCIEPAAAAAAAAAAESV